MDFYKNKLINKIFANFKKTYSQTNEALNYVSPKTIKSFDKYVENDFNQKLKEVDIYFLLHLKYDFGLKLGLFQRLKIWWSGLEPLYLSELVKKNKTISSKLPETINEEE